MTEVFKTNVDRPEAAEELLGRIQSMFPDYRVVFDLEDCDRILKVVNPEGEVTLAPLLQIVLEAGYELESL
ncbi:MAG: hypothetical protein ACPF9D_06535 [Owenweeksia sp.]